MRFLARRAIFYVIALWAALTINFLVPRLMPGDPVQSLIARYQGQLSTDSIAALRVLFGLDEDASIWQQYVEYLGLLLRGDLGLSFTFFPTPVGDVIAQALPWTLGLVGIATLLSFVLGTAIGTYIGWRRGTWADAIVPISTFFGAIPYFWLGLIVILAFAVVWPILPASHGYDPGLLPSFSWPFIASVIEHAILPALTIVVSSLGGWVLGMRNMMVTVLDEDYITVAEAKGLRRFRIATAYAARNAILPQVSSFALSLGFIVGGTLVMEMVFSYPGVGFVLFQAVGAKDYPLMQGIFLCITLSVLVANVLADIAYAILDPRTRQEA
ncbi:ABC transporter permease [Agrococcus jejuensis]|uniref:Peptide/nickel transport system permease protein n=1 Tax=Agrococcus jejuensis TaxID=399736 RepID=A0A1G8C7D3_9MICO|nr:ABC transporter permease [Agrococcus jejuensis]SDH41295.1 peptide/nickel transport system permease protein [Agrococcus jejuensis]